MGTVVNIGMFSGHASFSSTVRRPKGVRRGGRAAARRAARAAIAGDPRTSIRGASSAPVKSAPAALADDEDAWLGILRDAVAREGGTLRCSPSARPDHTRGVRAFAQYWRRGDASSHDEDDALSSTNHSFIAEKTKTAAAKDGKGPWSNALEFIRGSVDIEDDVDPAGGHPVLEALLARKRSESVPGERTDGMRIGLAVEGGGMKGVISAGACGEILRSGFADCFDAVYGSSAGAMNLTYYLANQPEGIRAYEEDLVDGGFLDLRRLPALNRGRKGRKGKRNEDGSDEDDDEEKVQPAMDVSYLVDGVMDGTTNRALRWDLLMNSRVPLKVVATSLDTLTPVVLEGPWRGVEDLKQCLKASAAVPTLAGPEPVMWRGQRLVDAAVMEPVPVHAAIADGCTHVLVLCTRSLPPLGEKRTESVSSDVSSVPPSSITPDSLVPAAAGNGPSRPNGGMFFSRVGMFFDRRRRRGPAPSAAGGEGNVAVGDGTENTTERRKRKNFIVRALGGMLYHVVRGALLTPPHMKDAWATYDLHCRLHDESEGGEMKSLDDALILARDDPDAAVRARTFPGGAHVFPIAPPVAPKGVSSLCQESEVLAAASEAGRQAAEAVFAPLLNRNIASWS
jgi:predicted patatin/cPLA2 family phospholipase